MTTELRDCIVGCALITAGLVWLGSYLMFAVHHDCSPREPLPSKAFGYEVPIKRICNTFGYQVQP